MEPSPQEPLPPQVENRSFATTQWATVLAAGAGNSPEAAEALSELCNAYWYPLYAYERRWAMAVIAGALGQLREEHATGGQARLYEELEGTLTGGGRGGSLADIGQRLGLSESAVKVASHRLRKRFGRVLREIILGTVSSAAEVGAELRHLQAILEEGLTTISLPAPPGNLSRPMG
jgi:hypothetical protein